MSLANNPTDVARHEHATLLCEAKGVHAAGESLGHSNIQTTMRYVKSNDDSLKNNQDLID